MFRSRYATESTRDWANNMFDWLVGIVVGRSVFIIRTPSATSEWTVWFSLFGTVDVTRVVFVARVNLNEFLLVYLACRVVDKHPSYRLMVRSTNLRAWSEKKRNKRVFWHSEENHRTYIAADYWLYYNGEMFVEQKQFCEIFVSSTYKWIIGRKCKELKSTTNNKL